MKNKVKIWDTKLKKFVTTVMNDSNEWHYNIFLNLDGEIELYDPIVGETYEVEEGRFIVLNFTNLPDKNDTEIYEGDIVEIYLYDHSENEWIGDHWGERPIYKDEPDRFVVKFEGFKLIPFVTEFYDEYDIIKIGNIYENPDLLGGSDV